MIDDGSSSPAPSSADEAEQWDSEEEFEVESLRDHRVLNNVTEYLVNWSDQGGRSWAPTWEPASNIAPEAIGAYYRANPTTAAAPTRRNPEKRGGSRRSERLHTVPTRGTKVIRRRGRGGS